MSTTPLAAPACKLVLIRHEHTELAGTFCGTSDPALDASGRAGVATLLRRLDEYSFQQIYSSDLRRARETAEAIAAPLQLRVKRRESLRELAFGEWEGLTWEQIVARDPDHAQRWLESYPIVAAPGGEQFASFLRRIQRAFEDIADASHGGCSAVVTHGGVIRAFLNSFVLGTNGRDITACPYGSCWEVERQGAIWTLSGDDALFASDPSADLQSMDSERIPM